MSQQSIHPVIESVVARMGLTRRQSEIVCRVAMGLGMPELSQVLSISPATVRTHLRDIFRTMKVRSRAELVSKILSNVLSVVDCPAADHADSSTSESEPHSPARVLVMAADSRVTGMTYARKVSQACGRGTQIAAAGAAIVAPRQA